MGTRSLAALALLVFREGFTLVDGADTEQKQNAVGKHVEHALARCPHEDADAEHQRAHGKACVGDMFQSPLRSDPRLQPAHGEQHEKRENEGNSEGNQIS